MPTRRDVLRRLGAAAVPLAGAATVGVGRSGATVAELESETPEYVSREFDEALLSRWQPRLRISHLDIQPHTTYAYVTRSQEQETVALSYWHTYRGQNGVVGSDSHFGDNEPVVVYINESTDELVSIAYSAYHWFAGRTSEPPTDGDGRPQLYAVKPWHNHTVTTEQGQLVDLEHPQRLADPRPGDSAAVGHAPADRLVGRRHGRAARDRANPPAGLPGGGTVRGRPGRRAEPRNVIMTRNTTLRYRWHGGGGAPPPPTVPPPVHTGGAVVLTQYHRSAVPQFRFSNERNHHEPCP